MGFWDTTKPIESLLVHFGKNSSFIQNGRYLEQICRFSYFFPFTVMVRKLK
jgi:hypothetical protein